MNQDVDIYPIHCVCGYDYEGYQTKEIERSRWGQPMKVVKFFSPKPGFQVSETFKRPGELIFTCPRCRKDTVVKVNS